MKISCILAPFLMLGTNAYVNDNDQRDWIPTPAPTIPQWSSSEPTETPCPGYTLKPIPPAQTLAQPCPTSKTVPPPTTPEPYPTSKNVPTPTSKPLPVVPMTEPPCPGYTLKPLPPTPTSPQPCPTSKPLPTLASTSISTPSPCPSLPGWNPTPDPTGSSTPPPCPSLPGWNPTPASTPPPCPSLPGWNAIPAPTGSSVPSPCPSLPIAPGKCSEVSVEGDATYCIDGPICSGSGDTPAENNCPKKGDQAVAACLKSLKSYVDSDKCIAPVDATCQKIKTDAWGCVWSTFSSPLATPAVTVPALTPAITTPVATSKATVVGPPASPASTTTAPTPSNKSDYNVAGASTKASSSESNESPSSSFGAWGVGGAVIAAAMAIVGIAVYKKKSERSDHYVVETPVWTPTHSTPV